MSLGKEQKFYHEESYEVHGLPDDVLYTENDLCFKDV